jgi:hypothetical protein
VATTYDRLGFILKHDKELEDEFFNGKVMLCYLRYVVVDKRSRYQKVA